MTSRVIVVGGGIAGLAAAHAFGAAARVTLVEASPRLGGKLHTERVDGFLVEAGADSFGTRSRGALELVAALGLADELIPTPAGGRVLVLRGGRLHELPRGLHLVVPTDLREVFRSPLLSPAGKLRVACDLVRRPSKRAHPDGRRAPAEDEAVAPFLRRHFGREYVERVAVPLLAGIHATDPELLSLRAAFPGLAAQEERCGSLIRAVRRAPGGPSRVTLAQGLGSLVEALETRLREAEVEIVTGRRALGLRRGSGTGRGAARWELEIEGGRRLGADGVVLATAPGVSAAILAAHGEAYGRDVGGSLRRIPSATTATVSLGFRRADVEHPLDALGVLVPVDEGRELAACTFSSSKFPGRAPDGFVLVRAYLPGARAPSDEEALAALALREVRAILGASGEPALVRVHRFEAASPQYIAGHRARVAALETGLPAGLAVAGCAYHGIGIPDCIESGRRAAARLLSETESGDAGGTAGSHAGTEETR